MTMWDGDTPVMCEITGCDNGAIEIKHIKATTLRGSHYLFQLELPVCGDHLHENIAGQYLLEEVKGR